MKKKKVPCEVGCEITAWGEEKIIPYWLFDPRCKATSYDQIYKRIRDGWTPEEAIETPPRAYKRKS